MPQRYKRGEIFWNGANAAALLEREIFWSSASAAALLKGEVFWRAANTAALLEGKSSEVPLVPQLY